VDTFQADTEYVMKIVDQQKTKMKKAAIKDMLKLVKAKAMTAFTKSGKRRAKGLSREGTAYFKAVKQILTADVDILNKIQQDLQNENSEVNNLIEKQNDGQKLTQKEQAKVNLALAMDTFR
jgi:G3E family GTPase